jgi:isopropylmalate/homocitrate/citramalate synthase
MSKRIEQPQPAGHDGEPHNGDAGSVRLAWLDMDTRTGNLTLHVSTGVTDPVAMAKALTDLAIQYAVERAVEASRIERATLADVQMITRGRR